jgi:HD domain
MESMAPPVGAESTSMWAERIARELLSPLGARWRHTVGVAERAREIGRSAVGDDADVLVAAAYLHDIGYAPQLRDTGFHPLDGARFVRSCGHERLAALVAFHCAAEAEARERGLDQELADFVDERSGVSRALAYCDLTTDPEGRRVEPARRLVDICARYGPEAPESRAAERATPALLDDVRMVESLLAEPRQRVDGEGARRR